jgi:hypothetical protein
MTVHLLRILTFRESRAFSNSGGILAPILTLHNCQVLANRLACVKPEQPEVVEEKYLYVIYQPPMP